MKIIEPKPRPCVLGILPRMLRMSDSVGTHYGLTSVELRRCIKITRIFNKSEFIFDLYNTHRRMIYTPRFAL